MSRPLTFTDRRRALLRRRVDTLEKMEERAMITESLGIMSLGIGVPAAVGAFGAKHAAASTDHAQGPMRGALHVRADIPRPRQHKLHDDAGWSHARNLPPGASRAVAAAASADWLTPLRRGWNAADGRLSNLAPIGKAPSSANGGGAASRGGGSGGLQSGPITSLRLPPPASLDDGSSSTAALLGTAAAVRALSAASTAVASATPSGHTAAAPSPAAPPTSRAVPSSVQHDSVTGGGVSGGLSTADPGLFSVPGGGAAFSFTYFPVYTLDYADGTLMVPGFIQYGTVGGVNTGWVDLRAQVRDTTVSTYSWDTTNLTQATNISGTSTYRLRFKWGTTATPTINSTTLTVTDNNGHQEVETYSFLVPAGTSAVSGGGPTASWPEALVPNLVLPDSPRFDSHYVQVSSNSGAAETAIALPTYNPNIPPLVLQYDSVLADPRPIVVEHHILDSTQSVPTKVSASLTFNGSAGSTYFYDTSQFNAGAIEQIALQTDATALSTGRYSDTVTVADYRSSTTTITVSGTATVLNGSADATHGSDAGKSIGAGWTVAGLQQITSATGGVILDVGGGDSLWFISSGGGYSAPAGEFSTLAGVSGGGYIRTMPDGTVFNFNSSGQETSMVDRNGLRTTYAYSSGRLTTITDPYSKVTTFAYDGSNKLQTITDPASRVATFTHSGGNLSGVTLPDSSAWAYLYDGSSRLTKLTDPRAKVVTIVYDSANRAGTVTRPDSTSETFIAYQERGYDTSGTSGSPAPALLMAEARASHTDPNSHTTELRPDWRGMGLTNTAHDPDGNVTTLDRDANGLPTITIDRLNRVSQDAYDAKGNVTTHTYPDLNQEVTTYNSFAEPMTVKNARGYTTSFTYDVKGNLTGIEDAQHNLTTMTYTANGRLETLKDARSNVTTSQYDSQDRLTTTTYPGGATTKIAYDSQGNPATVTDERGNSTTFSYDALNRKTGMTDALSNRTTYTFDSGGNQTKIDAPLSRTTSYAYDSMNRVTTVTDPLSHNTVYGYDSAGNLTKVTDALSRVTTYQYDAEDRRTVVIDPMSNRTTTTYDAEGQVIQVADRLNRITTYNYNSRGWVATQIDPMGNTTTYTFTATGKTASETEVASGGTLFQITYDELDRQTAVQDALGHTNTMVYDAVGNVIAKVDPNGNRTTMTYDARNRAETIKDALSNVTTYQYDDVGNRTVVIDPLSHRTTTAYDALNRATTITDALSGQTTMSYDAAGRRTGLTDSVSNRTTWAYDAADRLTTMTDVLGTATYVYDAANELTDQTDRAGRRTTFAYDSDGRQTNERWLNGGGGTIRTITTTYDAEGQVTGLSDPDATLTFTYDSDGRQVTAQTSGGGTGQPNFTLTSAYNAAGARTSLTDNLSSVGRTTYSYDAARRLTTITRSIGGTTGPQVVFGYDDANRPTTTARTIGLNYPEVATTLSYDAINRVTTITHGKIDAVGSPPVIVLTPLATYTYGYDAASRLTSESNAEGSVTYTYDNADQLTGTSGARTESFGYDANGNRNTTGYSGHTGNELSASPGYTYTYDAEGNLTAKTETATGKVTTFSYDYRDRLTGATQKSSGGSVIMQATYSYDALNRRIGTRVDSDGAGPGSPIQTWMVDDGVNSYADFNGSGNVTVRYLYGQAVDQLLARTDSGGTTAWYLTDKLGTVRDITNTSGTVIDHLAYDSFGKVTNETSPSNGDRFKFTGREYDAETGLLYYRARYYDVVIGRFVSQDPKSFAAGDPNLYRYVGNGPTIATDPSGLQGWMQWTGSFFGALPNTIGQTFMTGQAADSVSGMVNGMTAALNPFGGGIPTVPIYGNQEAYDGGQGVGQGGGFAMNVVLTVSGVSGVVTGVKAIQSAGGLLKVGQLLTTTGRTVPIVVGVNGQAVIATADTLAALGVTGAAAANLMMSVGDPGPIRNSLVRLVEADGNVVELSATTSSGEVTVITEMTKEGDTLILSKMHIDGPGGGSLGLGQIRSLVTTLGKQQGAKKVTIYGATRTTGANPGRTPPPMTFIVGD